MKRCGKERCLKEKEMFEGERRGEAKNSTKEGEGEEEEDEHG